MSAVDVWSKAVGLNGRSYNTSKLRPISAIFSGTLSCSAWAPSHVSLTPNATQAQGGGEVCVRVWDALLDAQTPTKAKHFKGSHTWLSSDTFVASQTLLLQLPQAVWAHMPLQFS